MKITQFEWQDWPSIPTFSLLKGEAIVIDPIRDFDRYVDYAQELGLTIKFVTETHIHADFASGALAFEE